MSRLRRVVSDLYHDRTNYEIIGHARRWALLSGLVLALSAGSLLVRGLDFGIEFTGGTAWDVQLEGERPSTEAVRDSLRPEGIADARISFREDRGTGATSLLVQATELEDDHSDDVAATLEQFGTIIGVTEVGPTWGDAVTEQAWRALVVFLLLVGIYLALRFEWRMSIAALLAVVHDILITVGIYSLTGAQVAPATVIAFLTILGFSLYDTVVIFDKVKEHERTLGAERIDTYSKMVNRALNQVLSRSLNTTITSVLPILSIMVVGVWYLGAVGLQTFALALLIGVLAGTYSSIFVAAPLLAWISERTPRHRALRERSAEEERALAPLGVRAGVDDAGALAAAERQAVADRRGERETRGAPDDVGEAEERGAGVPDRSARTTRTARPPTRGGVAPRPRKQRRRKRR